MTAAPSAFAILEAAKVTKTSGTRWRARLIAGNVQGSSGYYSEAMLRACAGIFEAGTHVFLDHPSQDEKYGRPERSVRDLAGKLVSAAVYENDGLYADVEVYPHFAPIIEAMAGDIGMSIRGGGTAAPSEDPNIPGPIITELAYIESVDFVTVPGAGGRLVALLESAREGKDLVEARNVAGWLESRLHERFTCLADDMYGDGYLTREERISLSSGVGDALKAFVARVESDAPQLFTRDLWVAPGPVPAATTEAVSTPKGAPVAEINEGAPPAGGGSEATPVDMTEAANRATARVGELETQLAEARENARLASDQSVQLAEANRLLRAANERITRLEGAETARFAVAEAFKSANLPAVALARVTAAVVGLNGNALPLAEGVVDRTRLKAAIDAQILSEAEYVASVAADRGAGVPRGMGAAKSELTEAQATSALADAYKLIGLEDDLAASAAKGR